MKRSLIGELIVVALVSLPTWATPDISSQQLDKGSADVVVDKSTSLKWRQSDNGAGISWKDALNYCGRFGGYWRLPSVYELRTLFHEHGIEGVPCWRRTCRVSSEFTLSHTAFWTNVVETANTAHMLYLTDGFEDIFSKDANLRALCVDGGPPPAQVSVPEVMVGGDEVAKLNEIASKETFNENSWEQEQAKAQEIANALAYGASSMQQFNNQMAAQRAANAAAAERRAATQEQQRQAMNAQLERNRADQQAQLDRIQAQRQSTLAINASPAAQSAYSPPARPSPPSSSSAYSPPTSSGSGYASAGHSAGSHIQSVPATTAWVRYEALPSSSENSFNFEFRNGGPEAVQVIWCNSSCPRPGFATTLSPGQTERSWSLRKYGSVGWFSCPAYANGHRVEYKHDGSNICYINTQE